MYDLNNLIPTGITVAIVVILMAAVRFILNRRFAKYSGHRFRLQIITLFLSLAGLIAIIIALPVSESTTGQLLSLLGLLLSATIALSATTLLGNILAGLMLRAIKNFRPGDFIRVGEHFGRVSERGLFHIEIQTEERDLSTLPNLYLVTNPVKVIRSSGTLITAEVSLGYDIQRKKVDRLLLSAAEGAGLEDPFVHVTELGDFSVTYRVAGLLTEVKSVLTCRSKLREMILDQLHAGGIEIVSPSFMNQRVIPAEKRFIPSPAAEIISVPEVEEIPEKVMFDKAEEAESIEKLRIRKEELQKELERLRSDPNGESDESGKAGRKLEMNTIKTRLERLSEYIAEREKGDS
ncbi:MAG: mechanosensitive ion channel family protein [Candidatus Zixiibacteriota bacterium]|nr:MAG: mechanosensitive ion channel family protein [candidate division Zixibacteria bacterium]